MKTCLPRARSFIVPAAVLYAAFALPAVAQTSLWWNGGDGTWGTLTNWSQTNNASSPAATNVPGSANVAVFNTTLTNGNQTITLGANQVIRGLTFTNTGSTTFLAGGAAAKLTNGISGLTVNLSSGAVTFGDGTAANDVSINLSEGGRTWANASPNNLTILSSAATFTRTNASGGNSGAAITFNATSNGVFNIPTTVLSNNALGLIGNWATYGLGTSARYAYNNAGTVAAYTSGTAAADATSLTDTTGTVNYDLAAGGLMGANLSANTLRIANTGVIVITNNGTTTLNSIISAGATNVTIGATAGGNVMTIGANRELVINAANNYFALNNSIADNGGGASSVILSSSGTGTVTLGGTNTFTGGLYLSGIYNVTLNNARTLGTGTITAAGTGQYVNVNGNSVTNPIYATADNTTTFYNGSTTTPTFNPSAVTGTGTIQIVQGGGKAHNVAGNWTNFYGRVNIQASGTAALMTITANLYGPNATWNMNQSAGIRIGTGFGTFNFGNLIGSYGFSQQTANQAVRLTVGNLNQNGTWGGALPGNNTIVYKIGTGTQTFGGSSWGWNTANAAGLTISNGAIAFTAEGALGTNVVGVTFAGGNLIYSGTGNIGYGHTNTVPAGIAATMAIQTNTVVRFDAANALAGSGTLTFQGYTNGSTFALNNSQNFAGTLDVRGTRLELQGGTIAMSNPVTIRSNCDVAFGVGATLSGTYIFDGSNITFGPNNGTATNAATINLATANVHTVILSSWWEAVPRSLVQTGPITGSGSIVVTAPFGAATLNLAGVNTYTNTTAVQSNAFLAYNGTNSGGSLISVAAGGALGGAGSAGPATIYPGGTLAPGNSIGALGVSTLALHGGANYNWQVYDAAGAAGTGYDVAQVAGDLDVGFLSATNPMYINMWTINATNGTNGEAINFVTTQSTNWTILTYSNATGGTVDPSMFVLNFGTNNGTSGFANATNGGTFSIAVTNNSLQIVYTANLVGTTIWTSGPGNLSTSGILNGNVLIFAGAGGSVTNNAVNSLANIQFSNAATGSYNLSGSTFTNGGDGIVNDSAFAQTISANVVLAAGQNFRANAGDLILSGAIDNGGNKIIVLGGYNTALAGAVSGTGGLQLDGSGTTTLSASNSYTGSTVINNGTLLLSGAGTIGDPTSTVTVNAGTVNLGGGTLLNSMLTLNGGSLVNGSADSANLTLNSGTVGAVIIGTDVTKSGNGTITLSGANTFNGALNVNGGLVALANGGAGAAGSAAAVNIASGATLLLSQSDQISDAAALTFGGGTLRRGSGVSEYLGSVFLTTPSTLDFGTGAVGTISFGGYSPSGVLAVQNMSVGEYLVLPGDFTPYVGTYFTFNTPVAYAFNSDSNVTYVTPPFTTEWSGASSTAWNNAGNWSNGVANYASTAIFNNAGNSNTTVDLDTNTVTCMALNFDSADAAAYTIGAGGAGAQTLELTPLSGSNAVTLGAAVLSNQLVDANLLLKPADGTCRLVNSNTNGVVLTLNGTLQPLTAAAMPFNASGNVTINAPILTNTAPSVSVAQTGSGTLRLTGTGTTTVTTFLTTGSGSAVVDGQTLISTAFTTIPTGVGRIEVQSGSLSYTAGVGVSTASFPGPVRVLGGTFFASTVGFARNITDTALLTSVSTNTGFVVTGGDATIAGALNLGTANSGASAIVAGGNLSVTGNIVIGNQTSGGRWSAMQVSGGSFTNLDTTNGLWLGIATGNNSPGEFLVTGGTATVEKISYGRTNAAAGNTGYVWMNGAGGSLYVGSGGLAVYATNAYSATLRLSAGTLGAKADYSIGAGVAVLLDGTSEANVAIKAADASGSSRNIAIAAAMSGTGGFTKVGLGTLTLSGASTYSGTTALAEGTLRVASAAGAGAGTIAQTDATSLLEIDTTSTVATPMSVFNLTALQTVTLSGNKTIHPTTTYTVPSGVILTDTGVLSGASLTKAGNGTLILSGVNTYTNTTTVSAGALELSPGGALAFVVGTNGSVNGVSGAGTAFFRGTFNLDLTGASTNNGDSWNVVSMGSKTYDGSFAVAGFTNNGSGTWAYQGTNGTTYRFVQSTGMLTASNGVTPPAPYSSWLTNYPSLSNTNVAADPDGDGFVNGVEFAFDGNPTAGTPALMKATKVGTNVVFSFVANNSIFPTNYVVQSTLNVTNTGSWTNNDPVTATITNAGDQSGVLLTNEYSRKEFTVPVSTKDYFRVHATLP